MEVRAKIREDKDWQHGAFTKVFLDALTTHSSEVDVDHRGVISMQELVNYMSNSLQRLTSGDQQLGYSPLVLQDLFVAALRP
jgi:hypothetical protein